MIHTIVDSLVGIFIGVLFAIVQKLKNDVWHLQERLRRSEMEQELRKDREERNDEQWNNMLRTIHKWVNGTENGK